MSVRPYTISAPPPPQYMLVGARPPPPPSSSYVNQPSYKSNSDQSNEDNSDEKGSSSKSTVLKVLIGLLVGVIVCGVPLAVITTLYVQEKSHSSSDNGTNSTTAGTSTLPSQCSTYTINADNTRNGGYGSCSSCYCDNTLTTAWYRFLSPAGTQLSTTVPSVYYCGTTYPGWFNGTYPTTVGDTTAGTVCVNMNGYLCYSLYSVSGILVTNCGSFYVFNLRAMSYCMTRYCTS